MAHLLFGALILTGLCCYKQTWQRLTLAAAFMNIYDLSRIWAHIHDWRMFYSKDDNLSHTSQTQHSIDAWWKCATAARSMFASKWILLLASTLVLPNHYRCFAAHSPGLFLVFTMPKGNKMSQQQLINHWIKQHLGLFNDILRAFTEILSV